MTQCGKEAAGGRFVWPPNRKKCRSDAWCYAPIGLRISRSGDTEGASVEPGWSAREMGQNPLQRKLSGVMVARYRERVRESGLRICVYACGNGAARPMLCRT